MFLQKLCIIFVIYFSTVFANNLVDIYIPANNSSLLLEKIDGKSVIQRTLERVLWTQNKNQIYLLTNDTETSFCTSNKVLVCNTSQKNDLESVCETVFHQPSPSANTIVIVSGNQPFLDPKHIDFAIQQFSLHKKNPNFGAIVLLEQDNVCVCVCKKEALYSLWQQKKTNIPLQWSQLNELSYKVINKSSPYFVEKNVYTQSDIAYLNVKYQKPRIFLLRSGGFDPFFVNKINSLWAPRSQDLVARCKNTTKNNLDVFSKKVDLAFLRFSEIWVDNKLQAKTYTAKNTEKTKGIFFPAYTFQQTHLNLEHAKAFAELYDFSSWELLNADQVEKEFFSLLKIQANRRHKPSLGFIALMYILHHYPDHLIVLVDFTFQGVRVHPWSLEKEFSLNLEKQNRLIRLLQK